MFMHLIRAHTAHATHHTCYSHVHVHAHIHGQTHTHTDKKTQTHTDTALPKSASFRWIDLLDV